MSARSTSDSRRSASDRKCAKISNTQIVKRDEIYKSNRVDEQEDDFLHDASD